MTTVRLPAVMERKLQLLSISRHRSKSHLIKEALEQLFKRETERPSSYELGVDYFGRYGSGDSKGAETYKKQVKDKIRAKYASR